MHHSWIPSTLGHGHLMCQRCCITDREAIALNKALICQPGSWAQAAYDARKSKFKLVVDNSATWHKA